MNCNLCGAKLEIFDVNFVDNNALYLCPNQIEKDDEHTFLTIPLTEDIEKEFIAECNNKSSTNENFLKRTLQEIFKI